MDRLCLALADKLERDNRAQGIQPVWTLEPDLQQPVHPQYFLSTFTTLQSVLDLVGIPSPQLREQYVKTLVDFGFETPQLLLGLAGNAGLLADGLKMGHALCLANLLRNFYDVGSV